MNRDVAIANRHPRLRVTRAEVSRAIHILDAQFEGSPSARGVGTQKRDRAVSAVPPGELSIVFLTDPALARIHAKFMNDPSATDVITFEGDRQGGLAGEICVSVDTAARFVGLPPLGKLGALSRSNGLDSKPASARRLAPAQHGKFSAELALYVVHGWLHLAGYDDRQPAAKRRMRAAEKRAMALLGAARAVPDFRLK